MNPRATLAVVIVALWLGGMAMMFHRNANRSQTQQLTEVALRIQPATFYYSVERNGEQIGAASSALDTTANTLVSEEYFVGDYPAGPAGGAERTSARWQTRLTRGFRLADLTIDIARPTRPFSINASVEEDTALFIAGTKTTGGHPPAHYTFTPPLFTPSLAPVAFMLAGPPKIGRTQVMSVFDPMTRTVMRPELRIRAESLFTVVDSAAQDAGGQWAAAHRDTVRAWRLDDGSRGLSAWVDAEGRLVASQLGDLSTIRTAFEIAFKNVKAVPDTISAGIQRRKP
ncbi:MAG TPA: hypothetical protein VJV97_06925 [Gemmatimonadaceae bacterium]|nr:hypothetical protein [Gemmatimonadaceae bacterium]